VIEPMLTSGEVARQLGVSVSLLRKLETQQVTPPARRLSRFRIYTADEVETLRRIIANRRARATQPLSEAA
jgi:DNA-binding transcriptional MerR regulator